MTASNFERALPLVLAHEGGYVDNPKDPGGATNLGITIGVLAAWRGRPVSKADVRKLTRREAAPIYRKQYWDAVRGDDLPAGLDYAVFDFAVNSGVTRAVTILQGAIGAEADGHPGEKTVRTAKQVDAAWAINQLCDRRLAFLRKLKTWRTFGKGWAARVAGVRAQALAMARGEKPAAFAAVPAQALPKADGEVKVTSTIGGKGAAATGAGAVGGAVTEAAQQVQPLADVAEVLKWVFIALLVTGICLTLYATLRNRNREAAAEVAA